jgi:diaminopimelate decarboxylase
MLAALAAYQRGFAGRKAQICYAMKANSSLAMLQVLAQAGCGFDIVSGGELERVLAAGGRPRRRDLFRRGQDPRRNAPALDAGIGCFNVESEAELDVLSAVARRQRAARAGQHPRQPQRRPARPTPTSPPA